MVGRLAGAEQSLPGFEVDDLCIAEKSLECLAGKQPEDTLADESAVDVAGVGGASLHGQYDLRTKESSSQSPDRRLSGAARPRLRLLRPSRVDYIVTRSPAMLVDWRSHVGSIDGGPHKSSGSRSRR